MLHARRVNIFLLVHAQVVHPANTVARLMLQDALRVLLVIIRTPQLALHARRVNIVPLPLLPVHPVQAVYTVLWAQRVLQTVYHAQPANMSQARAAASVLRANSAPQLMLLLALIVVSVNPVRPGPRSVPLAPLVNSVRRRVELVCLYKVDVMGRHLARQPLVHKDVHQGRFQRLEQPFVAYAPPVNIRNYKVVAVQIASRVNILDRRHHRFAPIARAERTLVLRDQARALSAPPVSHHHTTRQPVSFPQLSRP